MSTLKTMLYPYKMGSASCKELSGRLNARRVYADRNYRGYRNHVVVNWGSTTIPQWIDRVGDILNHPDDVARTTNKLSYFKHLREHGPDLIPRFATNKQEAAELFNHGKVVVARTILNGHSGNGIVVCRSVDELPDAKLYTLHCRHRDEFRIHVFDNKVISEQQKKRRSEREEVDTFVRNVDNGWVFCRSEIDIPDAVKDVAVLAVQSSGLLFGAVDVAYRAKDDKAFALEINTAPNVMNTTAEHYEAAITEYINNNYK